ncbi:hypothetical protein ACFQ0K_10780 [Nocardioides caeni]|uniref:hypothetical protein n=1 Tax=Nocardioides caeni TaxID=574700 RepID=UPI00130523C7|nr:hypothetical protein [Nocardioides caeni]
MPPALARLRRALGRWTTDWSDGSRPRGEGGGSQVLRNVPLMTRARTVEDADLRLLLDARLSSPTLSGADLERVALALIVPAAAEWVRRQRLDALAHSHGRRLPEIEEVVALPLRGLGAELLSIEVVAAEHLLASPSGDDATGADA